MNVKALSTAVSALALSAVLLTGCGVPSSHTPDPKASAAQPAKESVPSTAPVETPKSFTKKFGEVVTYKDGVSISASEPTLFVPSDSSAGLIPGQQAVLVHFVITNNSPKPLDPTAMPQVSSGGQQSMTISDVGNEQYGSVSFAPTMTILPGQTIEWNEGYSVIDPADVTLKVAPSFVYDATIFTTK